MRVMHIVHTLGQAKNFSSGCGKKRRLYGGSASRSSHGKRRSKRKTFKSAERRTIAAFRQGQAKSRIEETVARDCVGTLSSSVTAAWWSCAVDAGPFSRTFRVTAMTRAIAGS